MRELDFDELDRAVSSLMSDLPTSDPSIAAVPVKDIRDEETVVELSDTSNQVATPVVTPTSIQTTPQPVSPIRDTPPAHTPVVDKQAVSPPAMRRSRQFMDIVRPNNRPAPAKSAASREGVAISPASDTKDAAGDTPDAEAVSSTTAFSTVPDLAVDTPAQIAPPIDNKSEPEAAVFQDETEAMTSPFLPDANEKVEKRPLGTVADGSTDEHNTDIADVKDGSQAGDDDSIRSVLPVELSQELIAVEAGRQEALESTPYIKPANESVQVKDDTPPPTQLVPPNDSAALLPMHETSDNDGNAVSVYDTSTYHQPLAHPPKKKSGWLTVLLIIGLLVLSAAGGAAYYYFTTSH